MSTVVVFIDLLVATPAPNGGLPKSSQELLTLAATLGEVAAAVAGEPSSEQLEDLGRYGVQQLVKSSQPELADYSVLPKAEFLAQAAEQLAADIVLADNSGEAKEVAARAALLLDAGVVSDVVGLSPELIAEKSVLAGSYLVSARVTSARSVFTVKANSLEPVPAGSSVEPKVQQLSVNFSERALAAKVVQRIPRAISSRPELTEARIVIAGGRGVNGDFGPLEALADVLGGAVGASRAATDAGWIEHSLQIGQTGKTVSPQLYVSAGISGAIQQKAGMQTSKVIVAVNKDPESPVFEIADFGIVGDLFEVLPQAVEEIKRRRQ
ncbi:electron transfer flavoprotein subunit alpha/FixB family protein [Psychromicrobium lacuslunae]|uniref:Electron transfer flavoprotein subunit alpha n=1 Tax=Psychromicrobium lacuslunae TaxID=1618207 RepID=A0A0D4BYY0_9MICC|nr:electron transfer flavoprotein subunit alpha/FixB family protein [Psychromicrobium lacuslunae]AJT41504.1 electron transfer flavoprotein subunit alpha [Psychromicrobium lacuslunae]